MTSSGSAEQLIEELEARRVEVFTVDDGLRYAAPVGALTPGLRVRIAEVREALVELLTSPRPARVRSTTRFPASGMQRRLWFLEQLAPGGPDYNLSAAFRIRGRLDRGAFRAAVRCAVRRHEVLRTTFTEADGAPIQVVHAYLEPEMVEETLTGFGDIDERVRDVMRGGFDLAAGPLLRCHLLSFGGEQSVLVVSMHHIIGDDWSLNLLLRHVVLTYQAFLGTRPLEVHPLVQFPSWCAASAADTTPQAVVCADALADVEPPVFGAAPTARPPSLAPGIEGPMIDASVLDGLARDFGTTAYVALAGATGLALAAITGQLRVSLGTPITGRQTPETEQMIGPLVNTAVLVVDVTDEDRFGDLVLRLRRRLARAHRDAAIPFDDVVAELRRRGHRDADQLTRVWFVVYPDVTLPTVEGLEITRFDVDSSATRHDVRVAFTRRAGYLAGGIAVHPARVSPLVGEALRDGIEAVVGQLVADPWTPLGELVDSARAQRRLTVDARAAAAAAASGAALRTRRDSRGGAR